MSTAEVSHDSPEDESQADVAAGPSLELVQAPAETREEWVRRWQQKRLQKPDEALMQEAAEIDLLTHEDEIRLGRKIQEGDMEARNQMVTANIRLAAMIAQRFQSAENDFEDLVHEGIKGLFRAADAYDPDSGNRFSTLAGMTIVQHIKRHLARMGRTIPLPEDKYRLIGSAYSIEERLVQERQRMVTADEIAPHIGTLDTGREVKDDSKDAADIRLVLAIGKGSVSLSKPIFNDPENISLQDMLEDKEEDIPAAAVANIQADLLTRILGWLNEPEKRLISALYGLSGQEQLTIKAASEMLGISQKTVVKTRNEILEKLRTAAQDEGLGV